MTRRENFKKLMTMYNFDELDSLTDRLIGEEIGMYDLSYMEYNHHYSFHRKLLYDILKLAPQQFAQIHKQYITALKKGIILK